MKSHGPLCNKPLIILTCKVPKAKDLKKREPKLECGYKLLFAYQTKLQ
jgi:hypothetical protein